MAAHPMSPLCLVRLSYLKPLAEVDVYRPVHVEWLKAAADEGVLLIAGRTDPATGGVLIFRGEPDKVEPFAATDPFIVHGVASMELVAFRASVTTDEVAALL